MPASSRSSGPESGHGTPAGHHRLEARVEDVLFRNEENGFSILRVRPDSVEPPPPLDMPLPAAGTLAVVGVLPFCHPGDRYVFDGAFARHREYGVRFAATGAILRPPRGPGEILGYLASGALPGIGEKMARRIVDRFGDRTLEVLRTDPLRLSEVTGIGDRTARKIADAVAGRESYQELLLLLAPYGIGPGLAHRIERRYGDRAAAVVRDNPYRLAEEVSGIGFLTADRIARSLGLALDSPERLRGAAVHVLDQAASLGHTELPADRFRDWLADLLQVPDGEREGLLARLRPVAGPDLVFEDHLDPPRISRRDLAWAERSTALRLRILLHTPAQEAPGESPEAAAAALGLQLSDSQREALDTVLGSTVSVITGGPGTGKTTLIRVLVRLFGGIRGGIRMAAPTGRAAKRMAEAGGMEARTIHRLLEVEFLPEAEGPAVTRAFDTPRFRRGPDNPLDAGILIIDEMSMVDVLLFADLLSAIRPGTRVVLVGDADQLPPVGPGDVLRDLMASGLVPVVRLSTIFRQAAGSRIVANAHRILQGGMPEFVQSLDSDCFFVEKETPEEMAQACVRLVSEILPIHYRIDPVADTQVLAPMRRGPAGVTELNQALQEALRPFLSRTGTREAGKENREDGLEHRGFVYRAGDKVIHTKNDYDLAWNGIGPLAGSTGSGVFNGETGTILEVGAEAGVVLVEYDGERVVPYDRERLVHLDPAYAVTVHKSQGSEYPVVVLVLPAGPPTLLCRSLLYTAVTRARRRLFLISNRRVLHLAVRNQERAARHTALARWLSEPVS